MAESQLLLVTAASIALLHTVLGPDHYLPFVAMGKARGWSVARTLRVTLYCGCGHIVGSVVLGLLGVAFGTQLARLVAIESLRGDLAGWALLTFGLMYLAWGVRRAGQGRTHTHVHAHGSLVHSHPHDHRHEHAHVHDSPEGTSAAPWALFIIFVLGPCEALIPLFMYPASQQSWALVVAVALVFSVVTVLTMIAAVALVALGLHRLRWPGIAQYSHAVAGASIAACGAAITFAGL